MKNLFNPFSIFLIILLLISIARSIVVETLQKSQVTLIGHSIKVLESSYKVGETVSELQILLLKLKLEECGCDTITKENDDNNGYRASALW